MAFELTPVPTQPPPRVTLVVTAVEVTGGSWVGESVAVTVVLLLTASKPGRTWNRSSKYFLRCPMGKADLRC